MKKKENEMTRQSLYKEVWSTPLTKLAKKYGLSAVGLANVCKRNNIPKPPAGYWAKLEHGKAVEQAPLPPEGEETPILIHAQFDGIGVEDPSLPGQVQKLIEFELDPTNKIIVPEQMSSPHPLTQNIRDKLRGGQVDYYKRINSECVPQILVSKKLVPRALLIMDTLVKALDSRKYLDGIFEQDVKFGIFEDIDCELSERAKKRIRETGQTHRSESDYDRNASGRLKMEVLSSMGWNGKGLRKNWSDGKTQRIETFLNDFICGLIRWSAIEREQNLEWARWEREREERERIAQEKSEREAALKAKREELHREAEHWQRAKLLRNYIEAVEKKEGPAPPDSELERWLTWARNEANLIDPLTEGS